MLCEKMNHHATTTILQVRQFPLYKSCPCTLSPPIFHAIETFPQGFFVDTIDVVLGSVEHATFALRNLNCGFILASRAMNGILEIVCRLVREAYLRRSRSSFLSGKNNRGSRTPRTASAARNRNASPSSNKTSQRRAQASIGR